MRYGLFALHILKIIFLEKLKYGKIIVYMDFLWYNKNTGPSSKCLANGTRNISIAHDIIKSKVS